MSFSRQVLLGIGMVCGGSVMLYAMMQQGDSPTPAEPVAAIVEPSLEQAALQPLTTDIETEQRILAQKQKERAARVAEQEKRAQQFLAEQESAEAQALAKSRAENQQYLANAAASAKPIDSIEALEAAQNEIATPKVQQRTDKAAVSANNTTTAETTVKQVAQQQQEAVKQAAAKEQAAAKKKAEEQQALIAAKTAPPKTPTNYKVQRGDGLLRLSRQYNIPVEALAQANNMSPSAALKLGQTLTIPTAKQIANLQRAAATATQAATDKPKPATQTPKSDTPQAPSNYKVQRGDGLLRLSRQYNIPVEALAQANNMSPSAALQLGQTLSIPSAKQIARLQREAANTQKSLEDKKTKEANTAKQAADAQQKLRDARKEARETGAKGSFGVQVSLARNQAAADAIAKNFKSSGYQVKTIATSRGIQVVVGPERGKVAALALKDKINSDPNLNTNGAWVRYW